MQIKLTRKNFIYMMIDIFLFVVVFGIKMNSIDSFNFIFILALIIYLFLLYSWFRCCVEKINFFTIILLLSFIYYFGQYLLNFFGFELDSQYNIKNTYTPAIINDTALYLLLNIVVLHFSVLLFYPKIKAKESKVDVIEKVGAFKFVAIVLLLVSFVCEILVLVFKIKINRTSGYAVALNTNYSGMGKFSYIVNFGSTLYLPALFASLVTTKESKLKILTWLSYLVYLILYFMSGSRFEAVVSLMGMLLILKFYFKKLNWKTFLFVVLGAILVLFLCSFMSRVRIITNYGIYNNYIDIIQAAFKAMEGDNFIVGTLSTTGFQILSVTAVYKNCPSIIDYSYGAYYLGGIIRIIPNLFGGENILITDSIDTIFYQFLTKTYGMGSSFIIEAYYNFGHFGILMMFLFGYLIGYVSRQMEYISQQKTTDLILTYFIFYIAATSFFWIRSDARFLAREIVYYYLVIRFLVVLVRQIFGRNNSSSVALQNKIKN